MNPWHEAVAEELNGSLGCLKGRMLPESREVFTVFVTLPLPHSALVRPCQESCPVLGSMDLEGNRYAETCPEEGPQDDKGSGNSALQLMVEGAGSKNQKVMH